MNDMIFPVTQKEAGKQGVTFSSKENKNAKFPTRLRELRENAHITQSELKDILGLSKSTVGLYETGDTLPDAKTLKKMADFYGVNGDYLLCRSDEKTTDYDVKSACKFTGLSEDAINSLHHDMHQRGESKNISIIIDYLIRNFYVSFLAVHLWNSLVNTAKVEAAARGKADDIVSDRSKYNKWKFLSTCEEIYNKASEELAPILKINGEEEFRSDIQNMFSETLERLERMKEIIKKIDEQDK